MTGSRMFTAKYHGRCASCEEPIEPGDQAAFADDEVVCAGCAMGEPSPRPAARPEVVCRSCWLVHPGSCEDAR